MRTFILFIAFCLPACLYAGNPSRWKSTLPAFDSLHLQLEESFMKNTNHKEHARILNKMYELAELHKESVVLRARAFYWDAQMKTDPDSALVLLGKSKALIDTEKQYEYDSHRIGHLKAKQLINKGEWLPAYIQVKKEEKYFREIKDTLMTGYICSHLGVIMSNLGDFTEALHYLQKADSCFSAAKQTGLQIKNRLNMCNLLYAMGRTGEAIDSFKSLQTKEEARRDTSFHINILLSLGYYTADTKEKEQYTNQAYGLAQAFGNRILIAQTSINKATSLYNRQRIDSAQLLYRKAFGFADATGNYEILLPAIEGITNTFSARSRWDSAYYYSALYRYYNDSISKVYNLSEINRIESRATIERYESDLVQMEIKTRMQRKTHIWIVTAIFSISLLICGGFWYMRKKEIMKKQLKEAEVKELNVSLENEILKNERYHLEIDSKNRELTSNIMLRQEKNEVLKHLLQQIDALGSEGELSRKKSSELKKQIKNHLQTDDEWEYFKLHFESVYPDFFVNLKKVYPALTENDLRLCAYIRIGMSNKQIAQMLSVLPDSIKISRYRIRKKFLLQQKDSLEDFLREI